jgi:hypothetical protein
MQLKTILLSVALLSAASSLFAQDKIMKKDGDVIDAKIKSVGTKTITYVRYDNQSGPEYTIVKGEVAKIKYQNGSEDDFGRDWARPGPHRGHRPHAAASDGDQPKEKTAYGANVVAIAPLQFTENGLGFSFSYERAVDKQGIIAFYLPVILTFNLANGSYYNYNTGVQENGHQDMMFYVMPGVKLYPTGSFGRVRYGIGPSLVIATGEKSFNDYNTGFNVIQTHTMLGMIINNSLNINPNAHIHMGLELGLGFSYLNRVGGINQETKFLAQGGFKIGYRF